MTPWPKDELGKIAGTDDLHISPFRDGRDDVRHADVDLVRRGRGRPLRAGVQRAEISLVPGRGAAEGGADHGRRHDEGSYLRAGRRADQRLIDDAYRAKYKGSPYLSPMIGSRARSATVKVMPRGTNA